MVPNPCRSGHRWRARPELPAGPPSAATGDPRPGPLEQCKLLEGRNLGLELCREANRFQALLLV